MKKKAILLALGCFFMFAGSAFASINEVQECYDFSFYTECGPVYSNSCFYESIDEVMETAVELQDYCNETHW